MISLNLYSILANKLSGFGKNLSTGKALFDVTVETYVLLITIITYI
jgi:hypothetical protein